MRIAIFGSGTQASRHLRAFSRIDGVEIAGVASRTALSAERVVRLGNPHFYAGVAEVLGDPTIAAVVIATPTSTHHDLSVAALRVGKHVLCECPIALSLEEADEMVESAARANRLLQVGMIHRFEAPWRSMVNLVKSRRLGPALATASQRLSAFTADGLAKPHHGDAFHELLTFDIRFFQWAFGAITEVAALADSSGGTARELTAIFGSREVRATCYVSDKMPAGYPFTENLRVLFTKGAAELTMRFWPDRVDSELRVEPLGGDVERIVVTGEDPFIAQARHFVAAIDGVADRRYADGEIALQLLRITAAAAEAAATGRTVYFATR